MEQETNIEIKDAAKRHVREFKRCLPMQVTLHELSKAIGKTDQLKCLDVGMTNGMMAYHLRKLGGKWYSAVADEASAAIVKEFVSSDVAVIPEGALPFKKKIFDVVVVFDYLERLKDDENFIEECHRILQPDGRIIIVVPRRKDWTLITPLRKVLNVDALERGWFHSGYTESELFSILKHGFDVHQMRNYGKVLVEFTDTIVQSLVKRAAGKQDAAASIRRIYGIAAPFYRIAYQADMLLFAGKGFKLIATAKRRTWRPRNAPVLVDGRSISEAVLSRIGS